MVSRHRPHDLLWLVAGTLPRTDAALPDWADAAWLAKAPVVVRRAAAATGVRDLDHGNTEVAVVAVGLRGRERHQRCAAWVGADAVARAMTPEEVARLPPGSGARPCLQALAALAPRLHALPLAWGVTGGVGFSLASGIDVLRDDSDLDLLVRAPSPADALALQAIGAVVHGRPARIDVQVETPVGAFALLEWLRTGGPVLLKTGTGPRLADDPWAQVSRAAPGSVGS